MNALRYQIIKIFSRLLILFKKASGWLFLCSLSVPVLPASRHLRLIVLGINVCVIPVKYYCCYSFVWQAKKAVKKSKGESSSSKSSPAVGEKGAGKGKGQGKGSGQRKSKKWTLRVDLLTITVTRCWLVSCLHLVINSFSVAWEAVVAAARK